jgi:membrane protein implicated in regulation of membrane protease activity
MIAFMESLTAMETFYAACALFGGALFLARTVMMFLGHSGDVETDFHAGEAHGDADVGFKLLSLHGLTAFFMMFGLVALALSKQNHVAELWAVAGGVAGGLLTVWLIGKIFIGMKSLQSDGTMRVENAVGQEGSVYLTIRPGKTGQVSVPVQGQLRIFDASTEESAELKTGERVKVVRVAGGSVLVVAKV